MRTTDIKDQEIKEGDYIVYSIREGDTAAMKLGKVVNIKETESSWSTTHIMKYTVLAIGNKKCSTISTPERICVITKESILNDILHEIDIAYVKWNGDFRYKKEKNRMQQLGIIDKNGNSLTNEIPQDMKENKND